jgi:hypothetical protein
MTVYSNLCTDEGMSVGWNDSAAAAPAGPTSMGSIIQTVQRAGWAWDPTNTRTEPTAANGMYHTPSTQTVYNTDGWHSYYLNDIYHATYPVYLNFAYAQGSLSTNGSTNSGGSPRLYFTLSSAASVGGNLTGATLPVRNYPQKSPTIGTLGYSYPHLGWWGPTVDSYNSGQGNYAAPGSSVIWPFDSNDYITAHSGDGFAYWMPQDDLVAQQSGGLENWASARSSMTTTSTRNMRPQIYVHRAFDYDTGEVLPYAMMNYKLIENGLNEQSGALNGTSYPWRVMDHVQTINLLTGKVMSWQASTTSNGESHGSTCGKLPENFRWPMPTGPQQACQYPRLMAYTESSAHSLDIQACSWDGVSGLPVYGKRPVFQHWWPVDMGEHPVFWPFYCAVPHKAYYPDDEMTFAPSPAMASRTYKVMRVPVQKSGSYGETYDPVTVAASKAVPVNLLTIPTA